jgi:hypothetical protein
MKKKIVYGISVLAIAAVAAWNVNLNSQKNDGLSDVMLANAEALAQEYEPVQQPCPKSGGTCAVQIGGTLIIVEKYHP